KYEIPFQTEYPIAGDYVDFAFPEHKLALEIKSGQDLKRYVEELQPKFKEEGWTILGVSTQEIGQYYNNFDMIIKRINRAMDGDVDNSHLDKIAAHPLFFSLDYVEQNKMSHLVTSLHVDVNIVKNDHLDIDKFSASRAEYENAVFVTNDEGQYVCGYATEKMSKSKYNVVNPDDMVAKYGADCFRMFEMFLGPIEQSKPWNTDGIEGVSRFLRKFWRLFKIDGSGKVNVSDEKANAKELKVLHNTIKKVNQDIERLSFNTCVSAFMECTNDLGKLNCHKRAVLQPLVILMAPLAPYISEELWHLLGNEGTVHDETFPTHEEKFIKEDTHTYPVQIGKKVRTRIDFPLDISKEEVEAAVMAHPTVKEWIDGKTVRKFVYVKGRIINIVV
ncbi:MAG: class I tRNA ligase family protein, partial [Chitinophagales bacterium]